MEKKENTYVCQGCLEDIKSSKIYVVCKKDHGIFACLSCCEKQYSEFPAILLSLKNKINKKSESMVKNGLTKDNKKVKIGDTYENILIKFIKKIKQTYDFDTTSKKVEEKIIYYISTDKIKWIEI